MNGDDTGSHQGDAAQSDGVTARNPPTPPRSAPMGDPAAEPDIELTRPELAPTARGDADPINVQPPRTNVLQRRLLRRRPPPPEAASATAPVDPMHLLRRIVRQAIPKAAHQACQLPLTVLNTSVALISLAEVVEKLAPGMLLAVIEGPDDRLGLIALDADVLASFVAMMTVGRVAPGEIVARKPTHTDAALVSPILDHFLQLLETGLIDSPQADIVGGFRFASFLADPRPLNLMLEDQAYQVMAASLDLADGIRTGEWLCAFPDRAPQTDNPAATTRPDVVPVQANGARLRQHVMLCETQLDAILLRRSLPLQDVLAFEPGTLLTLPMSALEDISLQSLDRQVVARGRLGQSKGARAIRITALPAIPDAALPPTGARPLIDTDSSDTAP